MSGLGPSFMKICTCGSSPWSGSRNAWTRIKNVNGASRLSKFWNFFVAIGGHGRNLVISLWAGDKSTIMEWRHSGSPCPKKFRVQKSTGKFLASIFWDQDGILLIIFQRAKLSTRCITHLCWCNWTFWRKNAAGWEGHQGGLFHAGKCPGSPGTCNPEETGLPGFPVSWSPTLFSGSGPVGYHLFRGLKKNNWKFANFRPTRRSLLPWRPVGRTTFWIFFEWLAKVRATG